MRPFLLLVSVGCLLPITTRAEDASPSPTRVGDELVQRYFAAAVQQCEYNHPLLYDATRGHFITPGEGLRRPWNPTETRRELAEMLGLDPLPERTPLNPVITGILDHPEFTVEKLHFQSSPGLYVTGNLYIPKRLEQPAPTILYVCGHGRVEKDGVSLGNKTHYQHHGAWFARHGYICLVIDTIQLGEIEGLHHGTYREGMWWWHARGYTPAGVEAWNGIRALDYLETRPEVDKDRFGITGRSGGGAYSWWIATLDERIKVAVPVAGITSMHNHIIDGCIEGHCDCMYMVNLYRWDFSTVAMLVAPRPLLISNTDKDSIFPLDGVYQVYESARPLWEEEFNSTGDRSGMSRQLGFHITEGPHVDTQELRIHAMVWFDRFLRGEERPITIPCEPLFDPVVLKVFDELPTDERVTTVQEWFVPAAKPALPATADEWVATRDGWIAYLAELFQQNNAVVASTPFYTNPYGLQIGDDPVMTSRLTEDGVRFVACHLIGREKSSPYQLWLAVDARDAGIASSEERLPIEQIELHVLDDNSWASFANLIAPRVGILFSAPANEPASDAEWNAFKQRLGRQRVIAWLAPAGVGPTQVSPEKLTHIRRRFALLGTTMDAWTTGEVRETLELLSSQFTTGQPTPVGGVLAELPEFVVKASGDAAVWALYASLFVEGIDRLDLTDLTASHRTGPVYLGILKHLDISQTLALAAERCPIVLHTQGETAPVADYARETARVLGWGEDRIRIIHDQAPNPAP
jgi:hypothetical protein